MGRLEIWSPLPVGMRPDAMTVKDHFEHNAAEL